MDKERQRIKNTKRIVKEFGKCRVGWNNGIAQVYSVRGVLSNLYIKVTPHKQGWTVQYSTLHFGNLSSVLCTLEGKSLSALVQQLKMIVLLMQ